MTKILEPLTTWYLKAVPHFLKANKRQRKKLILWLSIILDEWLPIYAGGSIANMTADEVARWRGEGR